MQDATPCPICLLNWSCLLSLNIFGDIFAGMHTDVFMMFDCLQRCIKERTPLPYINVGAMTRVNPPLAFIFFQYIFLIS